MITLAIDTCDARGSVSVSRDGAVAAIRRHAENEDYSSWLLPAVDSALQEASSSIQFLSLLAVATGPGSFTGVRVGLTAAKAWAEIYKIPVVGVSRLEAIAESSTGTAEWVAASYDAQRGQVFAALYQRKGSTLEAALGEAVLTPEDFLSSVKERVGTGRVNWLSLDPQLLMRIPQWVMRAELGEKVEVASSELAPEIAKLGEKGARLGLTTDSLQLDANYVRRSDAEIFYKGTP